MPITVLLIIPLTLPFSLYSALPLRASPLAVPRCCPSAADRFTIYLTTLLPRYVSHRLTVCDVDCIDIAVSELISLYISLSIYTTIYITILLSSSVDYDDADKYDEYVDHHGGAVDDEGDDTTHDDDGDDDHDGGDDGDHGETARQTSGKRQADVCLTFGKRQAASLAKMGSDRNKNGERRGSENGERPPSISVAVDALNGAHFHLTSGKRAPFWTDESKNGARPVFIIRAPFLWSA
eukprot:931594-Pyramimonas_sp.AAC.1